MAVECSYAGLCGKVYQIKSGLISPLFNFYVPLSLNHYPSVEICRFHFVDRIELNTLRPVGVGLIFVYIHNGQAEPQQSR